MALIDAIAGLWPILFTLAHLAAASAVTLDAVLRKRQVASVVGWVGLSWMVPLLGALLYLLFGINRIQREALALSPGKAWQPDRLLDEPAEMVAAICPGETQPGALASLARLGEQITGTPLLGGNAIERLDDGDAAYPAMLDAIDGAGRSVALLSYIFDNDRAGAIFAEALLRARQRGVEVRVLIDDIGARYSRPSMLQRLARAGLPVAAFHPTRLPRLFRYANLRNHRKILVVDGRIGFTGGMNIRESHWLALAPRDAARCLHFRIEGPVVADMQRCFATDWAFSTGEALHGPDWFPPIKARGTVVARGIPDGPDGDLDSLPHLLLGAIAVARRRLRILTPYFLPDETLLTALLVCAKRGVAVDIVLPERSNLAIMDWAMAPQFPLLIEAGCRIHLSPAPFDHAKLMVVDGIWSLLGSTNWDARSLRLNFEYNLECYDSGLATELDCLLDTRIAGARSLDLAELRALSLPWRLRNGLARLLSPYL